MSALTNRRSVFLKAALGSAGAQAVNMSIGLLSVPIGLHYFSAARYGIWLLIVSFQVYLSATQFGIGQAAAAYIANAGQPSAGIEIVRRSFRLLLFISVGLAPVLALGIWRPDTWLPLLGALPGDLVYEATWATLITLALFLLRSPASVFAAAFIGEQYVQWERFYVISLPAVFGLLALLGTIALRGDLVQLAVLTGAGQCLAAFASYFHLRLVWQRAKASGIVQQEATTPVSYRALLTSGRAYFVTGLAALVVWNTDNLVISHFLGPTHVAAYSVNFRLYSAAISCFVIVNSALWPMYGRAAGQGDWSWINQTYRFITTMAPILGGMVWVGAIAFGPTIINAWVGPAGDAGLLTLMALGFYGYLLSLATTNVTVQGSLNLMRHAAWIGVAEAIVNLGLSILLVHLLGLAGVALGSALANLLTSYWMLPRDLKKQTAGRVALYWPPIVRHAFGVLLPTIGLVLFVNASLEGWLAGVIKALLFIVYTLCSIWIVPPQERLMAFTLLGSIRSARAV